jgi:uncharacterized membrane protein YbhN (UPF0104 family)
VSPPLDSHHLEREAPQLIGLVALAALLYLGAAAGMAYIAGFDEVWHAIQSPRWWWLVAACGAVGLSFLGYYFGYRGVGQVEDGPMDLEPRERLAAVTAGFGGFLAHGGSAIDRFVMRLAGASKRETKVRVALLGGFEHAVLTVPGTIAAIVLLIEGRREPHLDFLIPWALGPALGFAIAFWAAARYRERLRGRGGWRARVSILLDTVHLVGEMGRNPLRYAAALGGMLLFWLADIFALWAAMAAFGYRMNWAAVVIGFGTAMIVTRRTGPLGGAGILMAALPPTLWQCGAPWVPAVLGTFAYRFFTLWMPMPFSFAAIPKLRQLGRESGELPATETEAEEKEPAVSR